MSSLFLSYSRRDEVFARRLATSLERLGATIWLDVDDIPAGMNWSSSIQEGLDAAQLMLLIISPDSMASGNVANEWQYFVDQKKPIVPLLWRPAKVHFQLNRLQHVNFHQQNFEQALAELRDELQRFGIKLQPVAPPESVQPPVAPVAKPQAASTSASTSKPSPAPVNRLLLWGALAIILGLIGVALIPRLNQAQNTPDGVKLTIRRPGPDVTIGDQMLCIDGTANASYKAVRVVLTDNGLNVIFDTNAPIDANNRWKTVVEVPAHTASSGAIGASVSDQSGKVVEKVNIDVSLTDKYQPQSPSLGGAPPDGTCRDSRVTA